LVVAITALEAEPSDVAGRIMQGLEALNDSITSDIIVGVIGSVINTLNSERLTALTTDIDNAVVLSTFDTEIQNLNMKMGCDADVASDVDKAPPEPQTDIKVCGVTAENKNIDCHFEES
jgi:hypothetical protein